MDHLNRESSLDRVASVALKNASIGPNKLHTFAPPKITLRDEIRPAAIFRETTEFYVGDNLVMLLATNKSSNITDHSELGAKINQVASRHRTIWTPLQNDFVSIVVRNTASSSLRIFNTDIRSFVCAFYNPEDLVENMRLCAHELASCWNERNSSNDKQYIRRESTKIIPLNVYSVPVKRSRKNNAVEFVLAATTYNYTKDVQHFDSDVTCAPENVYFQLRYQHNDTNPVSKMFSQNLSDWILFLTNAELNKFCHKLYEYTQKTDNPIDDNYVKRIETYFSKNKEQLVEPKPSNDFELFSKIHITDSEDSSDVDDPEPKSKKRKTKL